MITLSSISYLQDLKTYEEGERLQQQAWERVQKNGSAEILGFNFQTVITLGNRAESAVDLDPEQMKILGLTDAHLRPSSRGGEATLHSPGQMVIYPIVPLRRWGIGVKDYVDAVLTSVQIALQKRGVQSHLEEGKPGLFTKRGKIASIGIRVDRGVTLHGVSINVSNDLELFKSIRVCGVHGQSMDRVLDWGSNAEGLFDDIAQGLEKGLLTRGVPSG